MFVTASQKALKRNFFSGEKKDKEKWSIYFGVQKTKKNIIAKTVYWQTFSSSEYSRFEDFQIKNKNVCCEIMQFEFASA